MAKIELKLPTVDTLRLLDPQRGAQYVAEFLADSEKFQKVAALAQEHGGTSPEAIEAMPAAVAVFMGRDEAKAKAAIEQASARELTEAIGEMQTLAKALGQQFASVTAQALNPRNN